MECRPACRLQINGLVQRLQKQARLHRIWILLRVSSRPGPEFRLQELCLCVKSVEPGEIISGSPVLHPDIDVLTQKIRDLGAFRRRQELRTKKGRADGVGLVDHKLPPGLEPRHGHRHRESEQKSENAKQSGFDSSDRRPGPCRRARVGLASQTEANLCGGQHQGEKGAFNDGLMRSVKEALFQNILLEGLYLSGTYEIEFRPTSRN